MKTEIENLIIGYLNNELEESETEMFFSWIEEDEENKKTFFEIKAIYEMTPSQIDIEKSWHRLLNKREEQIFKKYSSSNISRHKLWRYAGVAAMAIIITSSFFLHYMRSNDASMVGQTISYTSGAGSLADIIELPDGTQVKLAASSTLHYSKEYGDKNREVFLDGEAFFNVAKMKNKPFVVNIGEQRITALGTQFNVLAYSIDSITTTTLIEGSIKLNTSKKTENILIPHQQLVYNKNDHSVKITNNVDTDKVILWISGYYHFTEEPLENILVRMGSVLNVRFVINSNNLKNKKLSGKFYSGQNAQDIMEIIQLSIPINYKIEGGTITITERKK